MAPMTDFARTTDLCLCGHAWFEHEPRIRAYEGKCERCECELFFQEPIRGP